MSSRIFFQLALPAEQYLRYYRGSARAIIVTAEDGRKVQLPAASLRPFVSQSGIYGRFAVTLDEHNRLIDILPA